MQPFILRFLSRTCRPSLLAKVAAAGMVTLGACGGSGGDNPAAAKGTVPLGGECRGFDECQPVDGKVIECRCTDQSNKPICIADANQGESCARTGNFQAVCRPGLRCVGQNLSNLNDLSCMAPAQANEACSSTPGCQDPYFCGSDGRCVLGTADLGSSCSSSQPASCKAPDLCPFGKGVCTAPAAVGEACERASAGDRSPCVQGAACDGSHCVPLKGDGADCMYDEECTSGICGLGQCGRGSLPADMMYGCGFG